VIPNLTSRQKYATVMRERLPSGNVEFPRRSDFRFSTTSSPGSALRFPSSFCGSGPGPDFDDEPLCMDELAQDEIGAKMNGTLEGITAVDKRG
jgi:hypothetical protein